MKSKKEMSPCPLCGCVKFEMLDDNDNDNNQVAAIYCTKCPYGVEDSSKTLSKLIDIHNHRLTICPVCEGDSITADIAKRMGHRPDIAFLKILKLENRLIELGELNNSPCFICGYKGENYFNPLFHNCMSRRKDSNYMKNDSLTCDDVYEMYE